ncbi:MAG: type II toxin-antitoxin system VapC family toxin [Gammaproteobacteria bacterium]
MQYADTSVLLALFLNEVKTADAWNWLDENSTGRIYYSDWTLTEFSSALGIKTRMNALDSDTRAHVINSLRQFISIRLLCVHPVALDFQRAAELCDDWKRGLRAGDALHLAIAERHGLTVCTLDQGLWKAAAAMSLPAKLL